MVDKALPSLQNSAWAGLFRNLLHDISSSVSSLLMLSSKSSSLSASSLLSALCRIMEGSPWTVSKAVSSAGGGERLRFTSSLTSYLSSSSSSLSSLSSSSCLSSSSSSLSSSSYPHHSNPTSKPGPLLKSDLKSDRCYSPERTLKAQ